MTGPIEQLDGFDTRLLAWRAAARDQIAGVRDGDWIRFACGTEARVAHLWPDMAQPMWGGGDGSFHLNGNGHASYSGGLRPGVPIASLTDSGERRPGRFWFFRHNWSKAHNGVGVEAPCRVFDCTEEYP